MAQDQAENFVLTKPGRLVYTHSLIAAVPFRNDDGTTGLPRYNCQVLIRKDNPQLGELQAVVTKVASAAFPGRDVQTLKLPLRDGDKLNTERAQRAKAALDFYSGHFVLFAQKPEKSRAGAMLNPPGLKVLQGGQHVDYSEPAQRMLAKPMFYNGVLASVSVQFKAFSGFGGGVTCYLDRVLSLNVGDLIPIGRDDDSIFGTPDSFSEYVGHATAESPSAGMANPW